MESDQQIIQNLKEDLKSKSIEELNLFKFQSILLYRKKHSSFAR